MIPNWCKLILILVTTVTIAAQNPCSLRKYEAGFVCVCNATYCDTLDDAILHPSNPDEILVLTSSAAGLRFQLTSGSWSDKSTLNVIDYMAEVPKDVPWTRQLFNLVGNLSPFKSPRQPSVWINNAVTYQTIIGFGGAITGSVVYNLQRIPEALEDHILESYYSDERGIGYSMLRMAIGGSDFDLEPWAYNETPVDDINLSNFTKLDPRDEEVVKRIKKIQLLTNGKQGLKVKGAAWSAPVWMKDHRRWGGSGILKPEYYQTWANYHLRFLELMKAQGIDIWALSTGNEPSNGIVGWIIVKWLNLGWLPKELAQYVAENLGPTIRNSTFKDVLILALDDQRSFYPWYFEAMQEANPKSIEYTDGFALHSYWDPYMPSVMLDRAQEKFPNKFIINTESSIGDIRYNPHGPHLGSWDRAVEYINMYLESLKHSVAGWIDWNLALDEKGGPNYVDNFVDAPVVINATGAEAYKQPIFYAIGHFSKFVKEGSVRIDISTDGGSLGVIGYRRPDNTTAVVIHNTHLEPVEMVLRDAKRGEKYINLPADSISTVIYETVF